MLDKNFSYKAMLGHEILDIERNEKGELVNKEPFDGPPKSDKEYDIYRRHYHQVMKVAQQKQGLDTDEGFVKFSAACE